MDNTGDKYLHKKFKKQLTIEQIHQTSNVVVQQEKRAPLVTTTVPNNNNNNNHHYSTKQTNNSSSVPSLGAPLITTTTNNNNVIKSSISNILENRLEIKEEDNNVEHHHRNNNNKQQSSTGISFSKCNNQDNVYNNTSKTDVISVVKSELLFSTSSVLQQQSTTDDLVKAPSNIITDLDSNKCNNTATINNSSSTGGKYVCTYCNLICSKPSVLQKHIRAHTNERPYPCVSCGFSFKTRSNLYKHCRSRTHANRVMGNKVQDINSSNAGVAIDYDSSNNSNTHETSGLAGNHDDMMDDDVDDGGVSSSDNTESTNNSKLLSSSVQQQQQRPYKPRFHLAATLETNDNVIEPQHSSTYRSLPVVRTTVTPPPPSLCSVNYNSYNLEESRHVNSTNDSYLSGIVASVAATLDSGDDQPLNLTNKNRKRCLSDVSATDSTNTTTAIVSSQKSLIKELLLKNLYADTNMQCPHCKMIFRTVTELELHKLKNCKGFTKSGSRYNRSNSVNVASIFTQNRSHYDHVPMQRTSGGGHTTLTSSASSGNISPGNNILFPLKSPGPFLGKTRLVDTSNEKQQPVKLEVKPVFSFDDDVLSKQSHFLSNSYSEFSPLLPHESIRKPPVKLFGGEVKITHHTSGESKSYQIDSSSASSIVTSHQSGIVSSNSKRVDKARGQRLQQQEVHYYENNDDCQQQQQMLATGENHVVVKSCLQSGGTLLQHSPKTTTTNNESNSNVLSNGGDNRRLYNKSTVYSNNGQIASSIATNTSDTSNYSNIKHFSRNAAKLLAPNVRQLNLSVPGLPIPSQVQLSPPNNSMLVNINNSYNSRESQQQQQKDRFFNPMSLLVDGKVVRYVPGMPGPIIAENDVMQTSSSSREQLFTISSNCNVDSIFSNGIVRTSTNDIKEWQYNNDLINSNVRDRNHAGDKFHSRDGVRERNHSCDVLRDKSHTNEGKEHLYNELNLTSPSKHTVNGIRRLGKPPNVKITPPPLNEPMEQQSPGRLPNLTSNGNSKTEVLLLKGRHNTLVPSNSDIPTANSSSTKLLTTISNSNSSKLLTTSKSSTILGSTKPFASLTNNGSSLKQSLMRDSTVDLLTVTITPGVLLEQQHPAAATAEVILPTTTTNTTKKFARPNSLALKPSTALGKQHHGLTPTMFNQILISPETPRVAKKYNQHSLNGNYFSYLGLKSSTRSVYCTLNKTQPFYVPQQYSTLSMYSEWRQQDDKSDKLYASGVDSRQRGAAAGGSKWKYTVAGSGGGGGKEEGQGENTTLVMSNYKFIPECNNTDHDGNSDNSSCSRNSQQSLLGGYESNDDYTYVRGRGRGRFVCDQCGIRCKKPSMLKKHIRTHSNVRPYTCSPCNFSFKTKGNLTKHLKSKAHTKNNVVTSSSSSGHPSGMMSSESSDDEDSDMDSSDESSTRNQEHEAAYGLLSLSQKPSSSAGSNSLLSPSQSHHRTLDNTVTSFMDSEQLAHVSQSNYVRNKILHEQNTLHPWTINNTTSTSTVSDNNSDHYYNNKVVNSSCVVATTTTTATTTASTTSSSRPLTYPYTTILHPSDNNSVMSVVSRSHGSVSSNSSKSTTITNCQVDEEMPLVVVTPAIVVTTTTTTTTCLTSTTEKSNNIKNFNVIKRYDTPASRVVQIAQPEAAKRLRESVDENDEQVSVSVRKTPSSTSSSGLLEWRKRKLPPQQENNNKVLTTVSSPHANNTSSKIHKSSTDKVMDLSMSLNGDCCNNVVTTTSSLTPQTLLTVKQQPPVVVKQQPHVLYELNNHRNHSNSNNGTIRSTTTTTTAVLPTTHHSTVTHPHVMSDVDIPPQPSPVVVVYDNSAMETLADIATKQVKLERNAVAKDVASEFLKLATKGGGVGEREREQMTLSGMGGATTGGVGGAGGGVSVTSKEVVNELMAKQQENKSCTICGKSFNKPSQLRLHMNIHYLERPFRCDPCSVSFRTRGHLQKHERSASHHNKLSTSSTTLTPSSEPRPFKCADCSIAFRIHGHLAKHLRSKMHIMKLECLAKIPFGLYAELERSSCLLTEISTGDGEQCLDSLKILAKKVFMNDPNKLNYLDSPQQLQQQQLVMSSADIVESDN